MALIICVYSKLLYSGKTTTEQFSTYIWLWNITLNVNQTKRWTGFSSDRQGCYSETFLRVPPYDEKSENCPKAVFDSSKEAFWCTEFNAKKNLVPYKVWFLNKNKKKQFNQNNPKRQFFKRFFLIFSETILCKQLGFFLQQDHSFELSKTAFGQIFRFVIISGDPSDLGGVKISWSWLIVVLQSKVKMFCDPGVLLKNPAYGRQSNSQPMQIAAPIPKKSC